jgi:hypothetical protein
MSHAWGERLLAREAAACSNMLDAINLSEAVE